MRETPFESGVLEKLTLLLGGGRRPDSRVVSSDPTAAAHSDVGPERRSLGSGQKPQELRRGASSVCGSKDFQPEATMLVEVLRCEDLIAALQRVRSNGA